MSDPIQPPPDNAASPPAPMKKKSPAAKSQKPGGNKGKGSLKQQFAVAALEACIQRGVNPFYAVIDVMLDPKTNPSMKLDAARILITRIEPELQAVRTEEVKPTPAVTQSTSISGGQVVKLVEKI